MDTRDATTGRRPPPEDDGYNLWLAGLGAAALLWDAGGALVGRFAGGAAPAPEAAHLRRATAQASAQAERATHEAVCYAMERLDLPARSEVTQLAEDIDRLGQQVDRLQRLIEED